MPTAPGDTLRDTARPVMPDTTLLPPHWGGACSGALRPKGTGRGTTGDRHDGQRGTGREIRRLKGHRERHDGRETRRPKGHRERRAGHDGQRGTDQELRHGEKEARHDS